MAVCLIGVMTPAQDLPADPRAVERQLIARQIEDIRQQTVVMTRTHDTQIKQLETDMIKIESDCSRLEKLIAEEQRKQEETAGRITDWRRQADGVRTTSDLLAAAAMAARPGIASRPPRTPVPAREDHHQTAPGPGAPADTDFDEHDKAVRELTDLLRRRLSRMSSTELTNAPVSLNDHETQLHAYQIRLGLALEFFVSEDRESIGVMSPTGSGTWDMVMAPREKQAFIRGLDILQGRQPPTLIWIPWVIRPDAKEGEPDASE
ncbi:MAG: hypothetical protein RRC34_15365 [Lentisphaeria bacterium]|nr:hypothetical protein [Lentisphaeria bacterium]